ncbi:hypothetical protein Dimus_038275 [Dionaea muscipula]
MECHCTPTVARSCYTLDCMELQLGIRGEGLLRVRDLVLACPGLTDGMPLYTCRCKKLLYLGLHGAAIRDSWWRIVWAPGMPPRSSLMMWLISRNRLNTFDRIGRMGMDVNEVCVLCNDELETCCHIFFLCCFSSRVIDLVNGELHVGWCVRDWMACRD